MLERLSLDGAPVDDGSLIPSYFPSKLVEVARDTLVTAFDEEQFKEPLKHQLHGIFRYCDQHITNPKVREDLLASIRNPGKCVICLGDHAAQMCPAREFEGYEFKEYLNKVGDILLPFWKCISSQPTPTVEWNVSAPQRNGCAPCTGRKITGLNLSPSSMQESLRRCSRTGTCAPCLRNRL